MDPLISIFVAFGSFLAALFGFGAPTQSYVAPPVVPPVRASEARVIFGGDMMFDRAIRIAMEEKGGDHVLSCLEPVLRDADLIVANLEGPITEEPSVSAGSVVDTPENYTFTFVPATASLLKQYGFEVVNLGNNHIENFGRAGVRSTISFLQRAGVDYFGDPLEQRVAERNVNGVELAFVNFNQFLPSSTGEKTVEQIQAARAAGRIVIVYTHWGDEYVPANDYQKGLAHDFIEAGAEMVIGSHPHVIQEHEIYAGKHIYYSLGNLVFDQYWEEAVRRGLLLEVTFSTEGVVGVREIFTELQRDRRTCPAS